MSRSACAIAVALPRTRSRTALALILALLSLTAFGCGGGGGGGGVVPAGPEAQFIFPAGDSVTDATEILVTGTAADPDGVSALTVNGVPADSTDGFQTWSVLVPLDPGPNVLRVSATSSTGVLNASAGTIHVDNQPPLIAPMDVTVDSNEGVAYIVDRRAISVFRVDLVSGARSVLSSAEVGAGPVFSFPLGVAVDTLGDEVLVVDRDLRALLGVDPASGERRIISDISQGSGPALQTPADVVYNAAQNEAIILDLSPPRLVKVRLDSGDRSNWTEGFFTAPTALEIYDNDEYVLVAENGGSPRLNRIRLSDGQPFGLVSGAGVGTGPDFLQMNGVTVDEGSQTAFVTADDEVIYAVDLLTGDRTIIADEETGEGPRFGMPRGIDFDPVSVRTIFVDETRGAALEIDPSSGQRRILTGTTRGGGDDFDLVVGLAIAGDRLVVGDFNRGAVVSVDPRTGNRTTVSGDGVGDGPDLGRVRDLCLGPVGSILLLDSSAAQRVILADLSNGHRSLVSESGVLGMGPEFVSPVGIEYDPSNGRALVIDNSQQALISVDLHSGDRSIVSGSGVGMGPAFGSPLGLDLDLDEQFAYVVDPSVGILRVDLLSGAREILSSSAVGGGESFQSPWDITLDLDRRGAYVTDRELQAVITVDLDSGDRTRFSASGTGEGLKLVNPLTPEYDPEGDILHLIELDYRAVFSLNRDGDRVLTSR